MKPTSRKMKRKQSRATARPASRPAGAWSWTWRVTGFALGTLLCAVLLPGADGTDESEQNNRKKIKAMSPAERARLKRNYEKFQKLTPEERARYHKIHEAIRNQPKLNRVMHSYDQWVKTLSPWEQEDLRKAKTVDERMTLIRKFRTEHDGDSRWKGSRNYFETMKILKLDRQDPRLRFMFWIQPAPPELYQAVIGLIEGSLPAPVKYPKPKAELSDFEQTLAVLQEAARAKQADDEKGSHWPPPEVVQNIDALLEKQQYHFFRESTEQRLPRPKFRNDDRQRVLVTLFLAKGLMSQLINSVRDELDQIQPPEDELQKFFETLDSKQKDYLLKYPPEELQERLKYMYLRENLPKQVRKQLNDRTLEARQLALNLIRGGDLSGFMDGQLRRGTGGARNRFSNPRDLRPKGPDGRGERPFRGRKPDQEEPRRPREKPEA